jgi:hypothetical protein
MRSVLLSAALPLIATLALTGAAQAKDSILDQLRPTTDEIRLAGKKGHDLFHPGYALGDYAGETHASTRHADGLGLFTSDKFKTSFTITGPGMGDGVSADCAGGQGRIGLDWLAFKRDQLAYVCAYGGAAPKDAELDLALSTGGKLLNRLAQPQRGGEFHYGDITLRVTTELLGGFTLSNGQTSDYLIARPDGTPVAAVRKTGLQPTVYLPKTPGPERDAAAVLALSLVFFMDPGDKP